MPTNNSSLLVLSALKLLVLSRDREIDVADLIVDIINQVETSDLRDDSEGSWVGPGGVGEWCETEN